MLLGLVILQIRRWVYFICSHPERSMTSLTSRHRGPVRQKEPPWPLSGSSRQHSRSAGWGHGVHLPVSASSASKGRRHGDSSGQPYQKHLLLVKKAALPGVCSQFQQPRG